MLRDIKPGERKFNEYHLGAQQSPEVQQLIVDALAGYKKVKSKNIRVMDTKKYHHVEPLQAVVEKSVSKEHVVKQSSLEHTADSGPENTEILKKILCLLESQTQVLKELHHLLQNSSADKPVSAQPSKKTYKKRPVQTPLGLFDSAQAAAAAHGITMTCMYGRLNRLTSTYYYVT